MPRAMIVGVAIVAIVGTLVHAVTCRILALRPKQWRFRRSQGPLIVVIFVAVGGISGGSPGRARRTSREGSRVSPVDAGWPVQAVPPRADRSLAVGVVGRRHVDGSRARSKGTGVGVLIGSRRLVIGSGVVRGIGRWARDVGNGWKMDGVLRCSEGRQQSHGLGLVKPVVRPWLLPSPASWRWRPRRVAGAMRKVVYSGDSAMRKK